MPNGLGWVPIATGRLVAAPRAPPPLAVAEATSPDSACGSASTPTTTSIGENGGSSPVNEQESDSSEQLTGPGEWLSLPARPDIETGFSPAGMLVANLTAEPPPLIAASPRFAAVSTISPSGWPATETAALVLLTTLTISIGPTCRAASAPVLRTTSGAVPSGPPITVTLPAP